jgi:hypothetical protein
MVYATLSGLYTKVIVAFFIMLFGIIIGRYAKRAALKFMQELEVASLFKKTTKLRVSFDNFVASIVAFAVYLTALFLALTSLNIVVWVLLVLVVLIASIFVMAIVLFLISLLPNLWAKFKLRSARIEVGKILSVKNITGKISRKSIQYVVLDSGVHIPYRFLSKNKFKLN